MTFGEFVKTNRLKVGLGLRKFCDIAGVDPSNWSKVERNKLSAPSDRETLERIVGILNFKKGEEDWHKFFDLAYISRKIIPDEVYSDEEVLDVLPIFFRTARGEKPTNEELHKIIEMLKKR